MPNDLWTFSASAGVGKDDFDDSYFGLQESTFQTFSLAADYRQPNGFGGGASYNYERYAGFQQSRSASPGQENDPLRDWTADSQERVNYFSIYATPPTIRRNTEVRAVVRLQLRARAATSTRVVPGGPLPPPNQLPNVFNKLQQLHLDVQAPAVEPPGGDVLVSLRAVPRLRLRLRPDGRQQHRPAQLAGPGLRLSPVHRALGRVRPQILLVVLTLDSRLVEAS